MKKILISDYPWETKVATTKNEKLQNVYFTSPTTNSLERCFFKGVVTTILPGIQTAFVEIGQEKSGFLHISEIDRELAIGKLDDLELDEVPQENKQEKNTPRVAADISKILKENEPILVQVSKEPVYEKGPKLTTCFALPGRFIVLMPNIARIGISKKIENREERQRLRELVSSMLPKGMGAIIRTSSEGCTTSSLSKDVAFLVSTWSSIKNRYAKANPGEKIYEDLPLAFQVVRDHLDADVEVIITNSKEMQKRVYNFVKGIAPEYAHLVKFFKEPVDLFEYYNINRQIESALHKKVYLPSGGSLIIEATEAMTVVDVNTGKFVGKNSLEETIVKTNTEAAHEIARQLRLRNIGGLIVIDFIDMSSQQNRQKVVRVFEQSLKDNDKFQSVVLKISEFGLVQMTRKRSGKTLEQQLMVSCSQCHGCGFNKSIRTVSFNVLHQLYDKLLKEGSEVKKVNLSVGSDIFNFITEIAYNSILEIEKKFNCNLIILRKNNFTPQSFQIDFEN